MFDSRKLDAFFEETHSVGQGRNKRNSGNFSMRRIIKLFLPCVAAALLGLLVVMPNIKKSVDLKDTITIPRQNEMEKLHMEETVFHATDNKNRVNNITADSVDEIEPGSQKYKIINPHGVIPTESGEVKVNAPVGIFDQKNKILELQQDVVAVIDGKTTVVTSSVIYDFDKEFGYGNLPVKANGDWGSLTAKAFEYDKKTEVLTLKGKNTINGRNIQLSSTEQTLIYQNENKVVAIQKAKVKQNSGELHADKIIGYFTNSSSKELQKADAFGNVVIKTLSEQVKAAEGYYDTLSGEVILYGSKNKNQESAKGLVEITQGRTTIKARKIIAYLDKTNKNQLVMAKAYDNVILQKENEKAYGEEGFYDAKNGKVILYGSRQDSRKQEGMVRVYQEDNKLKAQKVIAYLSAEGGDISKIETFGKVFVTTPKGTAQGDRGLYLPNNHTVELFENVKIEQNGNFICGDYAETNLLTSISRIKGNTEKGGRISGTFYRKRIIKNGDKK